MYESVNVRAYSPHTGTYAGIVTGRSPTFFGGEQKNVFRNFPLIFASPTEVTELNTECIVHVSNHRIVNYKVKSSTLFVIFKLIHQYTQEKYYNISHRIGVGP